MNKQTNIVLIVLIGIFLVSCSTTKVVVLEDKTIYQKADWDEVDGWEDDRLRNVKQSFTRSCTKLKEKEHWKEVCHKLVTLSDEEEIIREFFEKNFTPFELVNKDDDNEGLITGYYQPVLRGSRTKSEKYYYPLYKVPKDSVVVDTKKGTRKRVVGREREDCYTRAEIDGYGEPLKGQELIWIDSKVDGFFLQIQGSGLVMLDDKEIVSVGYAGKNSHKYVAIGRVLVEMGAIERDEVSMQSIRKWLKENPERVDEVLNQNPSYVFFRFIDTIDPIGSYGVPLTPKRSAAVDPRHVPMGYPLFISCDSPIGDDINALLFAQDKGGAVKGRVRADLFLGNGEDAVELAGHLQEKGKIWILLPNDKKLVQSIIDNELF
ncbi:MAG: murein transglycosylase A [Campylobacterales bacterium]|nr:murein transglycosylase A [Campylobacterales bacterium]